MKADFYRGSPEVETSLPGQDKVVCVLVPDRASEGGSTLELKTGGLVSVGGDGLASAKLAPPLIEVTTRQEEEIPMEAAFGRSSHHHTWFLRD